MSNDLLQSTENLIAGNALFTVQHGEERYTYHFIRPKTGKEEGQLIVRLLTGPNNTQDYTRLGIIDDKGNLDLDIGIGQGKEVPNSIALARWLAKLATEKKPTPEGLEIVHAGKCLRCGRTLTVPFPDNPYRPYGLGPECGQK